jgi:hypothetical protein
MHPIITPFAMIWLIDSSNRKSMVYPALCVDPLPARDCISWL